MKARSLTWSLAKSAGTEASVHAVRISRDLSFILGKSSLVGIQRARITSNQRIFDLTFPIFSAERTETLGYGVWFFLRRRVASFFVSSIIEVFVETCAYREKQHREQQKKSRVLFSNRACRNRSTATIAISLVCSFHSFLSLSLRILCKRDTSKRHVCDGFAEARHKTHVDGAINRDTSSESSTSRCRKIVIR